MPPRVACLLALTALILLPACDSITADPCDQEPHVLRFRVIEPFRIFTGSAALVSVHLGYESSWGSSYCTWNVSDEAAWSTSDAEIATVGTPATVGDADVRRIRGVAPGFATITARYAGRSEELKVYVCDEDPDGLDHCLDQPLGILRVGADELSSESTGWAWLPGGAELAHITRAIGGDAAHVRAVSAVDGAARTLVPADAGRPVDEIRVADPYLYARSGADLYRVAVEPGSALDLVIRLDSAFVAWDVAPGHQSVAWTVGASVITADPGTGARDTFPALPGPGHRLFLAPDLGSVLVVDSAYSEDGSIRVEWIDFSTRTSRTSGIPCGWGLAVQWEQDGPVLHGRCHWAMFRQPFGGDATTVLSLMADESPGAWSPDFGHVTYWRHVCPEQGDFCIRWDSELRIRAVGTGQEISVGIGMLHGVGNPAEALGPPLLSPAGAHVAYAMSASSPGVYIAEVR